MRRHLGVARVRRVVVGVRAVELVLAHARVLLQQPAAAAAREREAAGHRRGATSCSQPSVANVAAAAERAGDGLELEGALTDAGACGWTWLSPRDDCTRPPTGAAGVL